MSRANFLLHRPRGQNNSNPWPSIWSRPASRHIRPNLIGVVPFAHLATSDSRVIDSIERQESDLSQDSWSDPWLRYPKHMSKLMPEPVPCEGCGDLRPPIALYPCVALLTGNQRLCCMHCVCQQQDDNRALRKALDQPFSLEDPHAQLRT